MVQGEACSPHGPQTMGQVIGFLSVHESWVSRNQSNCGFHETPVVFPCHLFHFNPAMLFQNKRTMTLFFSSTVTVYHMESWIQMNMWHVKLMAACISFQPWGKLFKKVWMTEPSDVNSLCCKFCFNYIFKDTSCVGHFSFFQCIALIYFLV